LNQCGGNVGKRGREQKLIRRNRIGRGKTQRNEKQTSKTLNRANRDVCLLLQRPK